MLACGCAAAPEASSPDAPTPTQPDAPEVPPAAADNRFVVDSLPGCRLVTEGQTHRCETASATLDIQCFDDEATLVSRVASMSTAEHPLVTTSLSQHWPEQAIHFASPRNATPPHRIGRAFRDERGACVLTVSHQDGNAPSGLRRTLSSFVSTRTAQAERARLPQPSPRTADPGMVERWLLDHSAVDGELRFRARDRLQETAHDDYGASARALWVDATGGGSGTLTLVPVENTFDVFSAFQRSRSVPQPPGLLAAGYSFEYSTPQNLGEYAELDVAYASDESVSAAVSFVRCNLFVNLGTYGSRERNGHDALVTEAARALDRYLAEHACAPP